MFKSFWYWKWYHGIYKYKIRYFSIKVLNFSVTFLPWCHIFVLDITFHYSNLFYWCIIDCFGHFINIYWEFSCSWKIVNIFCKYFANFHQYFCKIRRLIFSFLDTSILCWGYWIYKCHSVDASTMEINTIISIINNTRDIKLC